MKETNKLLEQLPTDFFSQFKDGTQFQLFMDAFI